MELSLRADLSPLAVCRIDDAVAMETLLEFSQRSSFFAMSRDANELSVICDSELLVESGTAANWKVEKDWNRLEIQGILEFSMVGVLAKISRALAEKGISIFVISSYNTDHILVKQDKTAEAIITLKSKGYKFV